MVTEADDLKITYTTMSVEQADAFNRAFDDALSGVMNSLGKDFPI